MTAAEEQEQGVVALLCSGRPRLAAGAGLGGDVRGELDRVLAGLDVDHVPARDQVAGLGQRAVGGTGAASGPP
jgi:hypothetical protein